MMNPASPAVMPPSMQRGAEAPERNAVHGSPYFLRAMAAATAARTMTAAATMLTTVRLVLTASTPGDGVK